ncbi:non-canonical purine NTP diphosphatase [Porphyromonadaceae bacterium OttesenSCG-928-L07]|nr:non-canonical purine NTP diphosphatase [Porphyromonadaceae bacterium OttesenSCG-928-L07]MDL2252120.1 non-canonical purine NTP diphosphatase [Odoribacter sp. OttesenSCG-928-J03]MDL2330742.1 non-canonical purine NTP diphosphatase [Odoribacter sp. OttesenSCG-928-A06]
MELVFATNNAHKLEELRNILGDKYTIISLAEIGCSEDIPEDEDTLEGNALQKARYIKAKYGYDCFADDTGLEVEALDNRPGVYSARYAGEDKDAEANMRKVLNELEGIAERQARFRTVIALLINGEEHCFEGEVRGEILTEKHGSEGFGYDPIFRPEGYCVSFAEMPMGEKNKISHRGRAVQKLISFLNAQ